MHSTVSTRVIQPHRHLEVRLDDPRRYLRRLFNTADWEEATFKFGQLYTQLVTNPDEKSRIYSVHIYRLVDIFDDEHCIVSEEIRLQRELMRANLGLCIMGFSRTVVI